MTNAAAKQAALLPIPRWEFIALMASLLAMNAAAIDSMLPALGLIGEHFQLVDENQQQLIIYSYLAGFSVPQLLFGPLSDRFGRMGLMKLCLFGFIVLSVLCTIATSFWLLIFFRFLQGIISGGVRVVAVAVVRDLLAGRGMASVMSLIMTVFMIVPIIAPIAGEALMGISWRWTFGILIILGVVNFVWVWFRLPETLPPEKRITLDVTKFLAAYKRVLEVRVTTGYLLASGVVYASLFVFLGTSEQLFDQVFHTSNFSFWFAGVASLMAMVSYANSRMVERFGMRFMSHFTMLAFVAFALTNVLVAKFFGEQFWPIYIFLCLTMACFGMLGSNFNALAMEPHGNDAGSASAAYGFATTGIATVLGYIGGRLYNGTAEPILWSFAIFGLFSLVIVLLTEGGRLFVR